MTTKDKSVSLYDQKTSVACLPNPPQYAKLQDRRNRKEGYANYEIGKIYIDPDEVYILKDDQRHPREDKQLTDLYQKYEKPEDTLRKQSLILFNCELSSEETLCAFLIQKKIIQQEIKIQEFRLLGKKQEGKPQLLKITLQTKQEADHVFLNRKKLFGISKMFIQRELTREERVQRRMQKVTSPFVQRHSTFYPSSLPPYSFSNFHSFSPTYPSPPFTNFHRQEPLLPFPVHFPVHFPLQNPSSKKGPVLSSPTHFPLQNRPQSTPSKSCFQNKEK